MRISKKVFIVILPLLSLFNFIEGTDLHKMISSLLEKTLNEKKKNVPFGMYG
jgi:hypothetical protein